MNYLIGLTLTGIISGIFGGMVGAGAEILVVPLLTILGTMKSIKTRIGTSLIMLLPPIGIVSVYKFYKEDSIDIYGGLYMALLFTIFAGFSSAYAVDMKYDRLRIVFGIFTIACGIYILFNKEKIN